MNAKFGGDHQEHMLITCRVTNTVLEPFFALPPVSFFHFCFGLFAMPPHVDQLLLVAGGDAKIVQNRQDSFGRSHPRWRQGRPAPDPQHGHLYRHGRANAEREYYNSQAYCGRRAVAYFTSFTSCLAYKDTGIRRGLWLDHW
jgi:hypothetical protein